MHPSTASALATLPCLSSEQKTALMGEIAHEMANTIITISREIQRGTLDANHTAPFYTFIRTFQQVHAAQQRKLERKLARYRGRASKWRAERRWIRREFAEMTRVMEVLQQRWKARVDAMERRRRLSGLSLQMRRARLEQGEEEKLEQGSSSTRSGSGSGSGGLAESRCGESISGV
ncbi:hypothetical protein BJX64DRAFT_291357 [Aspergillus heterothallicus]